MANFQFGAGVLFGERTDVVGSGIAPQQFGVLQSVSLDFDWTTRELWGQLQFPVDIARGQCKISGRASFARVFGQIYRDLCFGTASVGGRTAVVQNEIATVPLTPTYTVAVANSSTFVNDLGVYFVRTGRRLERVATPDASREYSVDENTGIYTFVAADGGQQVYISYARDVTTGGITINLNSQLMGVTPTFKATFYNEKNTQGTVGGLYVELNACTSSKLSMPTRLDDYQIQEFDFSAFADPSGSIGKICVTE